MVFQSTDVEAEAAGRETTEGSKEAKESVDGATSSTAASYSAGQQREFRDSEEEDEVEIESEAKDDAEGEEDEDKGCCGSNKMTKYGVTKKRLRFLRQKHKYVELGNSPVMHLMLYQSIPAFISFMSISLYAVVDSIYVGNGVGETGLTGMGVYGPIDQGLSMNFAFFASFGTTSLATQALGRNDLKMAETYLMYYVVISLICCAMIMISLIPSMNPLLVALGANEEVRKMTYPYGIILCVNSITLAMNNGLGPFMRLENKPITSMLRLIVNAVLNAIIDPILIFVAKLELKGAALATLISGVIISTYFITWYCNPKSSATLHMRVKYLACKELVCSDIGKIILLGIGPTLQGMFISLVTLFINKQITRYSNGDENLANSAIGGYGVCNRIFGLLANCVMGIAQAAMPIFGFNLGAKQMTRAYNSIVGATFWIVVVTVVLEAIIIALADYIVLAFGSGKNFVELTSHILRIVMPSTVCSTLGFFVSNFFVILQKKVLSMITALSKAIFFVVLIYTLPLAMKDKYTALWICVPISDVLSLIVTLSTFIPFLMKYRKAAIAEGSPVKRYNLGTLFRCYDCSQTKEEKDRIINLIFKSEEAVVTKDMNAQQATSVEGVAFSTSESGASSSHSSSSSYSSSSSSSSESSSTSSSN